MAYYELTIHELSEKIKKGEVKVVDLVNEIYDRIEDVENKVEAFVTLTKESALERAKEVQNKIDAGELTSELAGIPVAIKDNICTKDVRTTCSSKMLENFFPPYSAKVVENLEKVGAIIIGKTNQDEFAMGSSTETSYFKKTKNPWDLTRVPGGSSGGSCAAVASNMSYASLGSDTGGSIRQPASYCGVVGLKPTYGLVSRFGLIAFASSLDQVGPFTKDVTDSAIMLNAIAGYDEMDSTSTKIEKVDYTKALNGNIKGKKIGIPVDFIKQGVNEDVKAAFDLAVEELKKQGAEIVEIKLNYAKYALPVYYILATAEASSNLARYDGIKYGHRAEKFEDLDDLYKSSRTEGFGNEVKRRIMLGTYVLSSGYYDAYYNKALKVRTLICQDFNKEFEKVDVIMSPTVPSCAFKFGEKSKNPLEMYLEDIFTVPVNIAGLPGISIPCGMDKNNLPIGLQFIAKAFDEENLLNIAYAYEQNTIWHTKRPNI
ncbi:MAG: Asp-tRNA(Asn)/Glu-tRNA(Gln) amidotransferase subunit GatA [Clostridia bacterium]